MAELELVDAALEKTGTSGGTMLVIEGAPGLGRSALAAAVVEMAAARGMGALMARGTTVEQAFGFGTALQLVEPPVQATCPTARPRLFDGPAAAARPVLDPRGGNPSLTADERFRAVHGLYWLIKRLTRERPAVIVVDDAHLVDEPSLLLLLHLADRLEHLCCSLVVTVTGTSDEHPLVHQLRSHPRATVLELSPLSADAVAELVRGVRFPGASDAFCHAVADLSGGNPLLAACLVEAVVTDTGTPDVCEVERLGALSTRPIRDLIERRIDDLGDAARVLAFAAAVLEGDAPLDAAAWVASIDRASAEKAALLLVDADLAVAADPLELSSPVVASALRSIIPCHEVPGMQHRAADALARLGRPVGRIAPHLVATHPTGDDHVVAQLWSAATQALKGADPAAAVAYLRRALAEPAPQDVRPDLLFDLGTAEAAMGDPSAIAHLAEAAALHSNRDRRALSLLTAGRSLADAGRTADAADLLDRALAQHPPDASISVALRTAHFAVAQLDRADGRVPAERSGTEPDAAGLGTPGQRAFTAYAALERALRAEGLDVARSWARSIARVLESSGAGDEPDTAAATAGALLWLGEPARGEPLLDASLAATLERGSIGIVATLSARRSLVRRELGDLEGAIADARRAIAATGSGWRRYRPAAHAAMASAQLARGDTAAARAALRLPEGAPAWTSSPLGVLVVVAQGDLELAEGRPQEAFERYTFAAEMAEQDSIGNPIAVPHLAGRALAQLRLGDRHQARGLVDEATARARSSGLRLAEARALSVAARIGDRDEAIELLEAAIGAFANVGARLDLAGAHLDLGAALVSAGRRAEGVDHLRTATDLASECGAVPLIERGQAELRRAGARATRPRSGLEGLTPGERRTAVLARAGHSNRTIAEQLFVSVKAVEWHLGNTYRKLDITSRRELAAFTELGD